MKTLKEIELYASWGDPFDEKEVALMNKEIKKLFGEGARFTVEQSDDGFTIKIINENASI